MIRIFKTSLSSSSDSPEVLTAELGQQTSPGRRGFGPKSSGHRSPGGGASILANKRLTLPFLALLAVLTAGLLFLLPGGLLQAQEAMTELEYAENDTGPVATFTAVDPEGRTVYWSLLPSDPSVTNFPVDPDGINIIVADAADDSDLSISMDGVLTFNFPPDYEMDRDGNNNVDSADRTYKVVVVSSDNAPGAQTTAMRIMMAYHKVTVMVTDVDEDGTVSLSALQPQVDVPLNTAGTTDISGDDAAATLKDQDASTAQINAAKWKWEQSSAMDGPWTLISGAIAASYTPAEDVAGMYLRLTATYDDERGDDKTAMTVSAHMVRAEPSGTPSAPTFTPTAVARSVNEKSPPGTNVGKPVTADDAPGDVLTYTISGGVDQNSYSIDPTTGQIMTGPRTTLNEVDNQGDVVEVTATDPGGLPTTSPAIVTITINDVNEAPTITAGVTRIGVDENTPIATLVSTYQAMDVDQDTPVVWSVSGADAGDFSISNESGDEGQLTFKKIPNFEMPADADMDNMYMVTVVATDAGVDSKNKMTAERAVVITVENVNEGGTVTFSSVQPKVRIPFTAALSDPDGMTTDVKWQWWKTTSPDEANVPAFTVADADTGARDNWEKIDDAETDTYTPVSGDIGRWLAAVPTYTDPTGPGQIAERNADTSDNRVIVNNDNVAPEFREGGEKPVMQATRYIGENSDAGDPIVANSDGMTDISVAPDPDPVMATDPNDRTEVTEDDSEGKLTHTLGGPDKDSFEIVPATGQINVAEDTKLDYESNKKSYMVTVTATDPSEAMATIDVTIMVVDVNEGPEFTKPSEGDVDVTVQENTRNLNIYTFQARDPEGRKVYWSLGDHPTDSPDDDHFTISDRGVLSLKALPNYEDDTGLGPDGEYEVQVVASDDAPGAGITAEDPIQTSMKTVTVIVTDVEELGAITWTPKYPHETDAVEAVLTDGDGESSNITWEWTVSGGDPAGIAADDAYTPAGGDVGKTLRVKATYVENDEDKTVGPVNVGRVREAPSDLEPPVFDANTANRKVAENAGVGTRLGNAIRATDTDPLEYTVDDTDNFSVNSSGQLSTAAMLNHEDGEEHTVIVTATDPWGGSATVTYTVTVEDVNEAPMISSGPTRRDHAENTEVDVSSPIADYAATDIDADDADDELTWSLEGEDAAKFDLVEAEGQLTFKESPNFEMPTDRNKDNVYKVTVVVSDDGSPKLMDKRQVEITVTDAGEDGVVTLSAVQPKTGIDLMASLTDPDNVTSTNANGSIDTGITWQWWKSVQDDSNTAPTFLTDGGNPDTNNTTGWEKITGAKSDTYKPVSGDIDHWLTARATYSDRDSAGEAMHKSSTNAVIINNDNVGPVFKDDNDDEITETTRKVREDATPNAAEDDGTTDDIDESMQVGQAVKATDDNVADLLTYTLGGPDAALFEIMDDTTDGTTITRGGQISLKTGTKLDYEGKNTYMVTVTAADPDGESASVAVTIKVTDVDEAPKIIVGGLVVTGTSDINYAENGMGMVATYSAAGPDAADATWSLSGADAGAFSISSAGVLTFMAPPNYESPADANTDNIYMVMVNANDGANAAMKTVSVRVTNEDDPGRVTFWRDGADVTTAEIVVGDELGGAVDDSDGNPGDTFPIAMYTRIANVTSWQWARSMDMTDWEDIGTGGMYTVMDDDAGYYLRATATYTDAEGSGKSEDAVTANAVGAVSAGLPGDTDNDGMIDKREVIAAFRAYVEDPSDKAEIIAIFRQYVADAARS